MTGPYDPLPDGTPDRANHPHGRTTGDRTATNISAIDSAQPAGSVQQALSSLTPEHRAVLGEIYRGRSVADAARTLGLRESTVKSRVHFAMQSLRLALEERGLAPPTLAYTPAYTADYRGHTRR